LCDGLEPAVDDPFEWGLWNGKSTLFFSKLGELGVTCGGVRVGMAQKDLDMTEAQATFQKMSGKAVATGMDGDFFLMPHSWTTTFMAF
jgi:hypothetical protein